MAMKEGCTPTSFLIYNLSIVQASLLLQQGVWSSTIITFHITTLSPPCPDFLFSLTDFSTTMPSSMEKVIRKVWDCPETHKDLGTIIENTTPIEERANAQQSVIAFLAALEIRVLGTKDRGDILIPHFNVFSKGALIGNDNLWTRIRDSLAVKKYHTLLQGKGAAKIKPFNCAICHGVDHPRGLCAFPAIEGWNRPKNWIPMGRNGPRSGNT